MPSSLLPGISEPKNFALFHSAATDDSVYDISDGRALAILEDSQQRHFWFHSRNRTIQSFLRSEKLLPGSRVLEVGCGTGTVLRALVKAGYQVTGVEMHAELARRAARSCPEAQVLSVDLNNPPQALMDRGPFDAVGFFDVLEHLDEPVGMVSAVMPLLRPDGLLVGTVPALPFLWSDYDAASGHRLRYTLRSLGNMLKTAGWSRVRCEYFFQVLVPMMIARRLLVGRGRLKISRGEVFDKALSPPGRLLNVALRVVSDAEGLLRRSAAQVFGRIPGSSIIFSARRS